MRRPELGVLLLGLAIGGGCNKIDPPASASESKPAPPLVSPKERELAYQLERQDGSTAAFVSEDFKFKSGERFRIRVRPGFPAYVYVVNRGMHDSFDRVLFPASSERGKNPLAKDAFVTVPIDDEWLRFDKTPGNEYLLLIASSVALPELEKTPEIPRDTFEAALAEIERKYQPDSSRRFRDHELLKLFGARDGDMALIARLALRHE